MRKALAGSVALASILLLLAVACAPARATTYTLGVPTGTTAVYATSYTNVNITSEGLQVTWTNSTALTVSAAYHYSNGTVQTSVFTWDVRYGPDSNLTLVFSFEWLKVVAANLSPGDDLWESGDPSPINSSTTMLAAGALRTVNLWQIDDELFVYWDKPTGLMVEMNMYLGSLIGWFNFTLSSTTAWTGLPAIPGYPFEAIGLALAIGVCTGLVYRRKHPRRASPP
jgi:hypothetical protein